MKKQTKPMICTKCGCEFEYDILAAKKERTSLGLYEIVNCPICGDECVRKLGKKVTEQALNKLIDKFYKYTETAGQDEFGLNADFSPYYGDGYIGIDSCADCSGKVNVLVLEDEEA